MSTGRGRRRLTATATAVSIAFHGGLVLMMLGRFAAAHVVEPAPSAAIMVEMAQVATSARTERNEVSPDTPPREEAPPDETPPAPVPVKDLVPIRNVAADVPSPFHAAPQDGAPPPPSAAASQAQATPSDRTAAPETVSGAETSPAEATWQSRLMAHLEKHKRYPAAARLRRERGTAYVRFTIDAKGAVLSAMLARSSGYPELDREAVAMTRRASPVPAPPPGAQTDITAPIRFNVR